MAYFDENPSKDDYAEIARFQLQLLQFQGKMEEVLDAFDISLKQFQALLIVKTFPGPKPITVRALANSMAVHPSSTSGLLARLESSGWIERKLDLTDRRIIRILLTDKGESLLANIIRQDLDYAKELRGQFEETVASIKVD